jgi:cytochrome P450
MGWGLTLTFLRWGPQFKLHRRLFQTTFTQSNVKTFRHIQVHEARKAVRSLLAEPNDWMDTTLLLTTSIIFRIAFGQEIVNKDSPYCSMSAAANLATTNGGIAGSTLVDIFPPARFFPDWMNISTPLRHARQSREAIRTIHDAPWAANMKDIEAGTATTSFMKTYVDKYKENEKSGRAQEMTIADIKGATGAVFIAGGNSTWSTVLSCMLFLTKYQDVQRKVQKELDEVVGKERLPTFDDRANLPYLERFINEVMRVLPLNPLVIPHKSLKDDIYNGMFIPKGSVVFANTKAMCCNPATYADPGKFDPDRYERGEPFPVGNFGFGRRKCPGNFLALASVYIFMATLLATFDIEKAVDADGNPIEPEVGVTIGLGGYVSILVVVTYPYPLSTKVRVLTRVCK